MDNSSPKSHWPVYAFGTLVLAGLVLTALGVRTCL